MSNRTAPAITRTMLVGISRAQHETFADERTAERWTAYCGEAGTQAWIDLGVLHHGRGEMVGEWTGCLYLTELGERVAELADDARAWGGDPVTDERIAEIVGKVRAMLAECGGAS